LGGDGYGAVSFFATSVVNSIFTVVYYVVVNDKEEAG